MFDSYSDTFRQCTEYMNRTASRIDAENDELAARMRSGNAV